MARGKLCARGWAAHEGPLWGERLTAPLVRQGGALRETTWPAALSEATRRLAALAATPAAVAVRASARATNEECFLAAKLARAALRTPNIDFAARSPYDAILNGIQDVVERAPLVTLEQLERAEVAVVVEGDLATTHPRAASALLRAAAGGARVVTLGARRTQLARLGARHLAAAPGAEGDLLNGLLAATLAACGDQPRQGGEVDGLEGLRRTLGAAAGDAGSAARVAELAEVGRWIAEADRAVFLPAAVGPRTRQTAAALASLAAIGGHLDRAGSGLLPLVPRCNWVGALHMGAAPRLLPGARSTRDAREGEVVRRIWGARAEVGPGAELDTENGSLPALRGLVVLADDPLAPSPQQARWRALLEGLECAVVLDAFATETTRAAHVVLPIAAYCETPGTYVSIEGRIQRFGPVTEPPGYARPGHEVLAALCTQLGSPTTRELAGLRMELAALAPEHGERVADAAGGWTLLRRQGSRPRPSVQAADPGPACAPTPEYPFTLALLEHGDWGGDPLVAQAPTLGRDTAAQRKLWPGGMVQLAPADARTLGVRQGWSVEVTTAHGAAVLPVAICEELQAGVLAVPFASAAPAAALFAGAVVVAARVTRV